MTLLLDTHVFLWWLAGDERLSPSARAAIGDEHAVVLVSAASAWEIATKVRLGKLPGGVEVAGDIAACVAGQGFQPLDISVPDAQRAGLLLGDHRDPFDRMIAAQSLARDIPVVSADAALDGFGVRRLW